MNLKLVGSRPSHKIVIAGNDLEKAQIFIDLIRVLQRVSELIAEKGWRGRAEGTYPGKIVSVHNASSECLKPAHRYTRYGSLLRFIADVVSLLDKRNDIF